MFVAKCGLGSPAASSGKQTGSRTLPDPNSDLQNAVPKFGAGASGSKAAPSKQVDRRTRRWRSRVCPEEKKILPRTPRGKNRPSVAHADGVRSRGRGAWRWPGTVAGAGPGTDRERDRGPLPLGDLGARLAWSCCWELREPTGRGNRIPGSAGGAQRGRGPLLSGGERGAQSGPSRRGRGVGSRRHQPEPERELRPRPAGGAVATASPVLGGRRLPPQARSRGPPPAPQVTTQPHSSQGRKSPRATAGAARPQGKPPLIRTGGFMEPEKGESNFASTLLSRAAGIRFLGQR